MKTVRTIHLTATLRESAALTRGWTSRLRWSTPGDRRGGKRVDIGHSLLNFRYALIDVGSLNIAKLRASLEQRAFLEILREIWNFDDPERIGAYLRTYSQLFFESSRLDFLE